LIITTTMANESEKKRIKAAAQTKSLYTKIQIALYIVWFVYRVLWNFWSFSWTSLIGLTFLSVINYLCLTTIFKAGEYEHHMMYIRIFYL